MSLLSGYVQRHHHSCSGYCLSVVNCAMGTINLSLSEERPLSVTPSHGIPLSTSVNLILVSLKNKISIYYKLFFSKYNLLGLGVTQCSDVYPTSPRFE
jgi:hypothetical protein